MGLIVGTALGTAFGIILGTGAIIALATNKNFMNWYTKKIVNISTWVTEDNEF